MDWLGLALLIVGHRRAADPARARREQGLVRVARDHRRGGRRPRSASSRSSGTSSGPSDPIVNLRILRNRQLAGGVAFAVVLGFALYSSVFALPVFLQNLLGYTAWDTGRVILPGAIASAFTMA